MSPDPRPSRRNVVIVAALAFVGVGLLLAARPFVRQMAPNPATPVPETIDVEVGEMRAGEHRVVTWRGLPVVVRRRSAREIAASRSIPLELLLDRFARNEALPAEALATDDNRSIAGHPEWLVLIAVNPHSGCRVTVLDEQNRFNDEAFVCPCDGTRFDALGRVRAGAAHTNLRVPPVRLVNPHRLRVG